MGFTCFAKCGIENFDFMVSERTQVNPDNSRAMSALTFFIIILFIIIHKETLKRRQIWNQPKPWCNDRGVLNLHYGYHTTIMTSRFYRHNPIPRGKNQPIIKSEFEQCMKTE